MRSIGGLYRAIEKIIENYLKVYSYRVISLNVMVKHYVEDITGIVWKYHNEDSFKRYV